MADRITKEHRSWNMSRIHGKDTGIEIQVRKRLFREGFRYRKNVASLPGKPDIVLRKYRTVIFVHGCYWHRHPFCKLCTTPKTNAEFWQKKFDTNVSNDKRHYEELEKLGWHVIIIWECEIKKAFETTMQRVINELEENYILSLTAKEQVYDTWTE